MRILPRSLVFFPLLAGLSGAPAPAAAQGLDLLPRFAARLTSGYASPLATGDTVRVRSVLINLSDSTLAVDVRPCEIRFVGELAVADVGGERDCRADPVRVAPGDSLWTERAFVVTSPPGEYRAGLRNGAFVMGRQSPFGASEGSSTVTVVEPGARIALPPSLADTRPPVRVPFVVRWSGEPRADLTERELERIAEDALSVPGERLTALPLHPGTPALGRLAHVQVSFEQRAGADFRLSLAVVHPQAGTCHSHGFNYSSSVGLSPALLGAMIALRLRDASSSARFAQCFPGNEPPLGR
ncbi:MAG TPA: hypothetical protein VF746_23070 [Longimicrobium sp.]|jgi:hypothetical protein